ncbi:hypothetical protein KCP70_22655 [Salmonella enterica subsp. enterica]|nr:hypothetical protein KCP70_22655 [Salmonella enterica subsp. enterica]
MRKARFGDLLAVKFTTKSPRCCANPTADRLRSTPSGGQYVTCKTRAAPQNAGDDEKNLREHMHMMTVEMRWLAAVKSMKR